MSTAYTRLVSVLYDGCSTVYVSCWPLFALAIVMRVMHACRYDDTGRVTDDVDVVVAGRLGLVYWVPSVDHHVGIPFGSIVCGVYP